MSRPRSKPFDDLHPDDRITLIMHAPLGTATGRFTAIDKCEGHYWLSIAGDAPDEEMAIETHRIKYVRLVRRANREPA